MTWTEEHDSAALAMRWKGMSNAEIAAQFGISTKAVANRFSYIGRPRSSEVVERRKVAKVEASSVDTEAMILTELAKQKEACEVHAEAVMAQGGFCALSERPLGSGKWAVCLPLIWPARAA
jgi:predicted transcriptional regulator